jgi:L-cystine uptake protein TcyP (sodium:dicarboxylate symporter family)
MSYIAVGGMVLSLGTSILGGASAKKQAQKQRELQKDMKLAELSINEKLMINGLIGKAILYDITGKQQLEIIADVEVDISHLPLGMYFLRSINETIKVVKK